jgi:hypothetical protein
VSRFLYALGAGYVGFVTGLHVCVGMGWHPTLEPAWWKLAIDAPLLLAAVYMASKDSQ